MARSRSMEAPSSGVLGAGTHHTDAFLRRPIFAVRPPGHDPDRPPILVASWDDALALHGRPRIGDLEPAWLAHLISGCPTARLSPYRRIRRLPRSHRVVLEADGRFHATPVDPFTGGCGPLPEDVLHERIRDALLLRLREDVEGCPGPIGCEHSSGLDSNAILGALRHGLGIPAERIHTLSFPIHGEGPWIAAFRRFHGLRVRQSHAWLPPWRRHDAAGEAEILETIDILGRPSQLQAEAAPLHLLEERGCRLLFSGFGGDQGLSHNGVNVATDLVAGGRLAELIRWKGGRLAALRCGLARSLGLAHRPLARMVVRQGIARRWQQQRLLRRCLTPAGRRWLGPAPKDPYPLEVDIFLRQDASIRQRLLADWVALRLEEEGLLAAACGMRKAFPLLDERLIALLLRQDPLVHAHRAGEGRRLSRMAFAPFLPPMLRTSPGKERPMEEEEIRAEASAHQEYTLELAERLSEAAHSLLRHWWCLDELRKRVERSASQPLSCLLSLEALLTLRSVNLWVQWLEGESARTCGYHHIPIIGDHPDVLTPST